MQIVFPDFKVIVKKYNHGFVLGKFMPLHTGHIYLLETAQSQCEKLTILVCTQPGDPIAGSIRYDWIRKQFPKADAVHHHVLLPRDQTQSAFWNIWKESIEKHCQGRKFEVVFSSESYGQRLADDWNVEHVEVDSKRIKYPISGTAIRNNPSAYKEFIPEIVKPYYKAYLR